MRHKRVPTTNKLGPESPLKLMAVGRGELPETKDGQSWTHTHLGNMAKSTRREVSEEPINIRREPLRTSNKPEARRRVVRRRDSTPTKGTQMQVSDDDLPPMTTEEDDDDNDTPRRLSDDEEGSDNDDEPGTSAKRAKGPDGQPRRFKSEVPPVSLPATKTFERDADGSVELGCRIPLIFVRPLRYLRTTEAPSLPCWLPLSPVIGSDFRWTWNFVH